MRSSPPPMSTTSPPAKAMPIEPGATYVFDLGYYDYDWWAKLDRRAMPHRHPASNPTPRWRWSRSCRCRRAPTSSPTASAICRSASRITAPTRSGPGARSRVELDTGKVLRILSNDLDAPAARDRRSLQTPLGDRAVLPLGQADPQDPPLSRHQRKCRTHPDRRRPDRFSAAAHSPGSADRRLPARSPSPVSCAPI